MANATAPAEVPTAIPTVRPLLVGWFGAEKLVAELDSRLEPMLEFGMELMLEPAEDEAKFDREVAGVLDGDADEDKVIDVAVPNFDPMVNRFTASTPGQQLRLC